MTSWEWLVEAKAMGLFAEPAMSEVENQFPVRGLSGEAFSEAESQLSIQGLGRAPCAIRGPRRSASYSV